MYGDGGAVGFSHPTARSQDCVIRPKLTTRAIRKAGDVTELVDRIAEQALIAARMDDPESGAAILLRGPAGVGKSALAENAVLRVGASRRILRTVGTSPEAELAMAGLYQLLQPLFPL